MTTQLTEYDNLNGFINKESVPEYTFSDSNKILRVNKNATSIEWTDESVQKGFLANQGDGATNTNLSNVGFCFNNDSTSGLFGYSGVIALRKNAITCLQVQASKSNFYNRIELQNDTLLNNERISFGTNANCGITGDASTLNNHRISFRTDQTERLRISSNTTENIEFFRPIQIDSNLIFGPYSPHIYAGNYGGSGVCGISFDVPYMRINFQSSISTVCQMNYARIDMFEPLVCNQSYSPKMIIIDGTTKTLDTNLTDPPIIYMKRNLTADSIVVINNISSLMLDTSPKWSIVTDGNGNSSTFNCVVQVGSMNILYLNNGTRTLYSSGSITLGINNNYEFFYSPTDSRMVLVKT